jgi:hypothetical protein
MASAAVNSTAVRQRANAKGSTKAAAAAAAAEQQQQQQQDAEAPITTAQWARYFAEQHGGAVFAVAGVALLCAGYDKGWMDNTVLCLVSLAICLVGLFFHEFRPYNVSVCVRTGADCIAHATTLAAYTLVQQLTADLPPLLSLPPLLTADLPPRSPADAGCCCGPLGRTHRHNTSLSSG